MDVVGGFVLADGTRAKALTGVDDDDWRFCVSGRVARSVSCSRPRYGLRGWLATYSLVGLFGRAPLVVSLLRVAQRGMRRLFD